MTNHKNVSKLCHFESVKMETLNRYIDNFISTSKEKPHIHPEAFQTNLSAAKLNTGFLAKRNDTKLLIVASISSTGAFVSSAQIVSSKSFNIDSKSSQISIVSGFMTRRHNMSLCNPGCNSPYHQTARSKNKNFRVEYPSKS